MFCGPVAGVAAVAAFAILFHISFAVRFAEVFIRCDQRAFRQDKKRRNVRACTFNACHMSVLYAYGTRAHESEW